MFSVLVVGVALLLDDGSGRPGGDQAVPVPLGVEGVVDRVPLVEDGLPGAEVAGQVGRA